MTLREADAIKLLEDANTPLFHKVIIKIFLEALEVGCEKKADFIMNRIIGKVTDKVEHSGMRPIIIDYGPDGKTYLGPGKVEE